MKLLDRRVNTCSALVFPAKEFSKTFGQIDTLTNNFSELWLRYILANTAFCHFSSSSGYVVKLYCFCCCCFGFYLLVCFLYLSFIVASNNSILPSRDISVVILQMSSEIDSLIFHIFVSGLCVCFLDLF